VHKSKRKVQVIDKTPSTIDVAYGFSSSQQLALGTFDRSCAPYARGKALCPNDNGEEGVCNEALSALNADNYAFVAAGIYYSNKCKRAIPLPQLPPPDSRIKRRDDQKKALAARAECPNYVDYVIFDDPSAQIVGYVHFGDSYAAGMGTGATSGDGCRIGENNYGELLHKSWNDDSILFESRVCSGDTTKGLHRQIDDWKAPLKTNVGSVSIGGNDIGFADLAYHCVLTPNTAHFGGTNRKHCLDAEKKARDIMQDQGENGLKAKLKAAYLRILEKSYRSVNHPASP
jgi:lysophospholipase L1-like esterase